MTKFRIVSNRTVCGHAPGSIVEDDDLIGGDVTHLERAGHIAPVRAGKQTAPVKEVDLEDEVQQ